MFKFVVVFLSLIACTLGAAIPNGLLPQLDGRIVGGTQTTVGKYPYVISLQRSGSHSCGGSLYSNRVAITAAHCLRGVAASALQVRPGSTDYRSGGSVVGVASTVIHASYNPNTMVNDIGLVKLASALSLGSNIALLPVAGSTPSDGTSAVVVGWGTTKYGNTNIPNNLQEVTVNIISIPKCISSSSYTANDIRETMICAGASGKDACQGDSGGPLAAGGALVGIVSWGYGCAEPNYPGVYTDAAKFTTWIKNNA